MLGRGTEGAALRLKASEVAAAGIGLSRHPHCSASTHHTQSMPVTDVQSANAQHGQGLGTGHLVSTECPPDAGFPWSLAACPAVSPASLDRGAPAGAGTGASPCCCAAGWPFLHPGASSPALGAITGCASPNGWRGAAPAWVPCRGWRASSCCSTAAGRSTACLGSSPLYTPACAVSTSQLSQVMRTVLQFRANLHSTAPYVTPETQDPPQRLHTCAGGDDRTFPCQT